MMDLAGTLAVLDCLRDRRIPCWVDGGWGIDALLGEQTQDHEDLDLVVAEADVPAAEAALRPLGYRHDGAAEPGLPARFVLRDDGGRQVDLHPVVFDGDGNGWQALGDGAWGAYPADGLTADGRIGERRVRCLTPALQLRHHLGYPPSDDDRHDLRLLARRYGLALPPGL
jgi:lincosamide nucleotidyltransferase A/C/D/E